ncbi:transposase [Acidisoma cladoniae]|uniref:transposase n=1 Tax=Acidisoma cladoniae TaxID=3040935 RepID=UPI00254C6BD3|nr:transposase [Acidisoma sp. PAMC 29798]
MHRIESYFPRSRRVINGIIFVIRHGLRWRDAPKDHSPHKTISTRFIPACTGNAWQRF